MTLNAVYTHYYVDYSDLLRETYPFSPQHTATYLADQDSISQNQYSYLWPYSGSFSSVLSLYQSKKGKKYFNLLNTRVLAGLEQYFDTVRVPNAYASYINSAPLSDRFYDDNIWIGIDFTDLYLQTKNEKYLDKAKLIWKFVQSGTDSVLGGGIYWCEQKKHSKNTCSNAPGAVYALKLFDATKDSTYFYQALNLYEWTKRNLQDHKDYLYYDNIKLDSTIGKEKYAYNSGEMMQAAVLLYKFTKNEKYLIEAQSIAEACYNHFFYDFATKNGAKIKLINKGNIWFDAIMLRGFIELYSQDKNKKYINAYRQNLDFAWDNMREENGLFNSDWSGQVKDKSKWLLTQFAMIEMYAKMSKY